MRKLLVFLAAALLLPYGMAQGAEGERTGLEAFAHGDGQLDAMEFGSAIYWLVAPEGANGLDANEFERTVALLGLDPAEFPFEEVDLNQDGIVDDDQEFVPTVGAALFEEWAGEGSATIGFGEFSGRFFELLDADGDGVISAEEYEPYAEWFGVPYEALPETALGSPETFLHDVLAQEGDARE